MEVEIKIEKLGFCNYQTKNAGWKLKIKSFQCRRGSHILTLVAMCVLIYWMYNYGSIFKFSIKQNVNQLIVVNHTSRGQNLGVNKTEEVGAKKTAVIMDVPAPVYSQYIPECVCTRRLMYPPPAGWNKRRDSNRIGAVIEEGYFPRLNSSCSDEGTRYQSGQNVISYSLWIDQNAKLVTIKNYQLGVLRNLEMMRKHYPGFSLRLYTNLPLNVGDFYCETLCKNQDLFWCDIRHTPSHGNLSGKIFSTWRFLSLGDPTVESFHSRDLDSLLSFREAAAVKDWLTRGDQKAIMLMRDREGGHNIPILAGLWGAHNVRLGLSFGGELREKIFKRTIKPKDQGKSKRRDQYLLNDIIFYPLAGKNRIVAYDAYNCVKWSNFTEVRPFPTRRLDSDGHFVADRVDFVGGAGYPEYGKQKCPVACRPEYGKTWVYC